MGTGERLDRFPFAGALRALATLSIVLYHSWLAANNTHRVGSMSQAFPMLGVSGVACFFALSGFLLGRRYVAALLAARPLPSWRAFARDRFLRIYPLYGFLVIACTLGARWLPVPGERSATAVDALAHLTFLFPFFRATALTVDPPMWTMATDAQFYVALPLIALLCAALLRRRLHRSAIVAAVFGALIAGSIAYRVAATPLALPAFNDFGLRVLVFGLLPGMLVAFGSGMLGILLWQRYPDRRKALGIAAAIAGVPLLWWTMTNSPGIAPWIVWSDVEAGLSAGLILFAGCALLDFPIVENGVVRWAERLSYAIYLTHFFVIQYVEWYITQRMTGIAFLLATFAISYSIAAAIALPLYLFVERPFLIVKGNFARVPA